MPRSLPSPWYLLKWIMVCMFIPSVAYDCVYIHSYIHTGTDFEIDLMIKTTNGTGTGEIDLVILTVDGIPLGENELLLPQQPGSYSSKWTVTAAPDPNCDPSQGFCEMWLPGNYTVQIGT